MIDYTRFWETLKKRGVSQYKLIRTYHISAGQLGRMRKNKNVSTHTIGMFCEILDCKVEDIMEYIADQAQ